MEATECGAAALGSVLAYFGLFVPLEELRAACGVSRDGSNALNILKAARSYGCEAKAFKKSIAKLRDMSMPVIAFWDFRHFLVIEKVSKKGVRVNDPATGPRIVSLEAFDRSFSGLVLSIVPGPDFKKAGHAPRFFGILAARLAGVKSTLAGLLAIGLLLVLPGLAVPAMLQYFVDDVLVGGREGIMAVLTLGMVAALLLKAWLTWVQQTILLRLETNLALEMSSRFLWRILRLPILFFEQRYSGEISSRVAINNTVAQLLSRELATNLLNALMVVFFAVLMCYYDPLLASITIGFALLNLLALRAMSRMRGDANSKLLQERGKLIGLTMAGLQMIETFKSTGSESDFFIRWSGYQARALNAQQQLGQPTQLLAALPSFLSFLSSVAVLLIGGVQVIEGRMSLGVLVAFQALLMSFAGPINRLVGLGAQLQEAKGELLRLDDVARYPTSPEASYAWLAEAPSADQARKLSGTIRIEDVSFGYNNLAPPLIKDFSLSIEPGQRVALVGPTGCGKSTIARLICGLIKPRSGRILFDGVPRWDVAPVRLMNSLAMVDQEIFLFEGTIRENLTLWDASIPETKIIQAAKDACIHDDITARRNGYGAMVEENGRNMSGGQCQRLEIARALVNDPSILVLDEATKALDPLAELAVDRNLRRRGCTCILVAHRLSTIRDSDEIIVLDKGEVVQRGTHDELVRQGGLYLELVEA